MSVHTQGNYLSKFLFLFHEVKGYMLQVCHTEASGRASTDDEGEWVNHLLVVTAYHKVILSNQSCLQSNKVKVKNKASCLKKHLNLDQAWFSGKHIALRGTRLISEFVNKSCEC